MERVVVYAHYNPSSNVDEYVYYNLKALKAVSSRVYFVSNSPISCTNKNRLSFFCESIRERPNVGYDFSMWRDVIESINYSNLDELVLTNSSIIGPFGDIEIMFESSRLLECDIWGLTSNNQIDWHIQSFFIAFKKTALLSGCFKQFWNSVLPYKNKGQVIRSYEVGLSQFFIENGFRLLVLFKIDWLGLVKNAPKAADYAKMLSNQNQTILAPIELMKMGMPYIKREILVKDQRDKRLDPVFNKMISLGIEQISK